MELKYEISNGTYHNTEGVEIDVNFDGSLDSMVFIYNKTWKLFEKLGYNRNKNLFAAVYDFRYGPNYNTKFMS